MYDENAKLLAIKAIGTVESNMNYGSVNYNDPITVGFSQWYGTRAAHIINRIRDENPASFTGVSASLVNSLNNNGASSLYWNSRYLTRAEGSSLSPVLTANKDIQNNQAIQDLDAYASVAANAGIDVNGNTAMMILFFVAYHQSPKRALNILGSVGPSSSIERYLAAVLNESVLGQYRNRYNTAYGIITAGNVDLPDPEPTPPTTPGGNTGTGLSRPSGVVSYVQTSGDGVIVHLGTGERVYAAPNGRGWFLPAQLGTRGADVPPLPPEPGVTPPTTSDAQRDALVSFVTSRLDRYAYSQGTTRLEPEKNMYTDCSGLMYFTFQSVLGINIGTYTGDQYQNGTLVATGSGTNYPWDIMLPGDLIYYDWVGGRNTVDHVEMYIGDKKACGHGGPDNGPDIQSLLTSFTNNLRWFIRRHVV